MPGRRGAQDFCPATLYTFPLTKNNKGDVMLGKWLDHTANVVGLLGILICAAAGIARVFGQYYILNFEVVTLFIGGTALMVMGCFLKLHQMALR
jgi:hypothetical protein